MLDMFSVNHIFTDMLKYSAPISGFVLEQFTLYLSEQCFSVAVFNYKSFSSSLSRGVPQGYVLGPFFLNCFYSMFSTFWVPLRTCYHCYGAGIQLYISFKPWDVSKLQVLNRCLDSIKSWMVNSFLWLNDEKKVLVYASHIFVPSESSWMLIWNLCFAPVFIC